MASRLKARGYTTGAFVGAFVLDSRYGLNHDFDVYDELYRHLDEQLDFNIQQARAEEVVKAALEWFRAPGREAALSLGARLRSARAVRAAQPYSDRYKDDLYLGEVAYADASLAPLLGGRAGRRRDTAPRS